MSVISKIGHGIEDVGKVAGEAVVTIAGAAEPQIVYVETQQPEVEPIIIHEPEPKVVIKQPVPQPHKV